MNTVQRPSLTFGADWMFGDSSDAVEADLAMEWAVTEEYSTGESKTMYGHKNKAIIWFTNGSGGNSNIRIQMRLEQ